MVEIRWHGRAGQGCRTAAKASAQAAFLQGGYFVKAFPYHGPERKGAPITAFTHIDKAKIRICSALSEPDLVAVVDASLLSAQGQEIVEGLKRDGILIANTTIPPAQIRAKLGFEGKIVTISATKIAQDADTTFAYVPILGGLAKILGLSLRSAKKGLNKKLLELKLSSEARKKSLKALEKGYEAIETNRKEVN